ncbi:hypothetical protein AG0111_0g1935 [Alternaria gaisen]|uniref:Uncharacterized protein n=1 Tax=Alternaria gaisen TaxID=167740 RepID=A0ACB6G414_9PLEO|nr:hypothetical protein AG0111_0g1935 [Alternaria gaisen]
MADNVPNLNVEELAAYATTKSQAGVSDEEILREITQMLREDGWKEAAIGPTIEAVVKRLSVVGGKGSPRRGDSPKANQDAMAQMMQQMMRLLSPMASRLEALERSQAEGRSESSLGANTTPPLSTPVAEPAVRKNKFPDPERFDGTRESRQQFSPVVAREMFSEGLREELQKLMLHTPKNGSLKEYMDKAIELSDDLYRIQLHGRNQRSTAHDGAQNHPRAVQREASLEAMDWEPSKVSQARESRVKTKRAPLTCYSCGKPGHIARDCQSTTRVRRAKAVPNKNRRELEKELEDLSSSDSEKEEL